MSKLHSVCHDLIVSFACADFFNWNRVKIRYCDGASFAGDSENKVCSITMGYLSWHNCIIAYFDESLVDQDYSVELKSFCLM